MIRKMAVKAWEEKCVEDPDLARKGYKQTLLLEGEQLGRIREKKKSCLPLPPETD